MRIRARLAPLTAVLLVACGGDRFSAQGAGGAGSGGDAGSGVSGQGGKAGTGGSGGTAGGGGSSGAGAAGAGGAEAGAAGALAGAGGGAAGDSGSSGAGAAGAPPTCQCGAAQYCRAGMCRDCSDVSIIEFSEPVELLDHPDFGLRFPRGFGVTDALFFTVLAAAGSQLWYTDDPLGSASLSLDDVSTPPRSGLVPLADGVIPFQVVFDELNGQVREARSGSFDGTSITNEASLGSPLSPGGFDTFGIAVVRETSRLYWMSTRDGPSTLRTGVLGTGNQDLVTLEVPGRDNSAICPRAGDDATPWVSADGRLMLFSAEPMDAQCVSIDGGASDLYAVPLDRSSGMPLATAVALGTVNRTMDASVETDPSLSPDLCRLYFASDGGEASGHDLRLYRADRR